ncbi:AraC family transcriptional regulator [Piscinibacter gummiphilus]|uniref:AraC family transcriptional regulator ligand-binding domain-containing protein n=1 Tax=Piscinibacter gummiphilus TaxID=946333 RepID=A0ABZ0CXW5_9BURK|nr:AraC family transcriptional regulator ligand-binding domain-containing protein [Piscinibacter gummiphilus]WOB09770.1 AraC family transcriptional regulator ligand-binding domain-containing protein [Piscinibacter gummiphilus]
MKHAGATISLAYVTALLEAAGVSPSQSSKLLRAHGVPEDDTARLTEQQFAQFYRAMAVALDDELLGLFSRPMRPGALKYVCLALLDAKNLNVVLHRWACMYRVVQDDFHVEIANQGDTARIALVQMPGGLPCRPFTADLILKLIHGVISWLSARRLPLLQVEFHFPEPAFAADYQVLYPGPVAFGRREPALVMDAKVLQLPIRRTRPQLAEFLQRAPEDWMFARAHKVRLAQRVHQYLAERLPLAATADGAAEALGVSVRTLHRRLAEEGATFQRIKDEFRRERALHLLTKEATPISHISEQLGFDSVAAFHRAFRGWTGDTPGAFRSTDGLRA